MVTTRRSPRKISSPPKRIVTKLRIKYTPSAEEAETGGDSDDGDDGLSEPVAGKPMLKPPVKPVRRGRLDSGSNDRPPPSISNKPIPFTYQNGAKASLAGLLPYLALGFAPQPTPVHLKDDSYECGINALATSLAAVRKFDSGGA